MDSLGYQLSTGGLGFGAYSYGATALVSHVDMGPLDTVAPNAISSGSIGISTFTNHVDLSWPATTDDASGTGVYNYQVWRNGTLLGSTFGLSWSDSAGISPNTTYAYTLKAVDYHMNAASTTFNATTPSLGYSGPLPSSVPEERQVGVRSTGTYWGAGGENIDVRSGNVNYTIPLVGPKGRGGWGVGLNLAYNSQNWRQDSGGTWKFDGDVGYGFGWRLQAGSILPISNDPYIGAADYIFTDATGAEYRLDQNSGGIWSSKASIYVWFDANTNILHFRDGSFWVFGCVSAAQEADGGTMYPTVMEDANGNQILINYQQSPYANWANSSARITTIEDVRAVYQSGSYVTYSFSYNNDSPRHLTSVTNTIGTGEVYTLAYTTQSLSSPINSQSFGSMIGAFIDPGVFAADGKSNRQEEYDPLGDRYSKVIVDELLPVLYKEYKISRDPDRHGFAGWSSSAIAAFTVAWERPDQFHKVLTGIGTFVDLKGGYVYPEKVLASEKKPIRIFMIDGRNDNRGLNDKGALRSAPPTRFLQNVRLMQALTKKRATK